MYDELILVSKALAGIAADKFTRRMNNIAAAIFGSFIIFLVIPASFHT
jgi:hypothetical protein